MVMGASYSFDANVTRAKSLLRERLETYDWTDRREMTRWVAAHLRTSYSNAEAIITDLLNQRTLQAHYGRLRVRPGSFLK